MLGNMLGISLLLRDDLRREGPGYCKVERAGRSFPLPVPEAAPGRDEYNGVVVLVVQHDDEQAVRAIETQFMGRKFPNKMTWDVGQVGVYQPPEEIVSQRPDSDPLDIWSCLRLRGLGGRLGRYEGGLAAVNDDRITRDTKSETTVGTWICHKDSRLGDIRLGPRLVASSLIVLVFRAEDRHVRDFASRLKDFFNRRHSELLFEALKTQPLFIYVALYECFNSFTTFFYQYQEIYMKVVSDHEKRRSSVFSRSFRLNQSLMHMSYCQEDILVHRTTLANIQKLNGDPRNLSYPLWATTHALSEELKTLQKDLDDFETKYQILSERFKAALELEFSLSGERLNWIMMLFTALTVLFTPIAFVAAVFSIVDSDPVWFLISASAVLCISIAICLWAFSSIQALGHRKSQDDLRNFLHKLPYQGSGYRRPKGPDDDSPPHDPGPKPPGPHMYTKPIEIRMSGHGYGHGPSSSQPPRPPSPPGRPPVTTHRLPVRNSPYGEYGAYDDYGEYGDEVPPPMPHMEYGEEYRVPPFRRRRPAAAFVVPPRPSVPIVRVSSGPSHASGDYFSDEEVDRQREVDLRERQRLREQQARRHEQELRMRENRPVEVRVQEDIGRHRAERQVHRAEEARRQGRHREESVSDT